MPQTPRNMSIHTVVRDDIQPAGQCAVPVLEEGNHNEERNEIYLGKVHSIRVIRVLFFVFCFFAHLRHLFSICRSVCDLTKIH